MNYSFAVVFVCLSVCLSVRYRARIISLEHELMAQRQQLQLQADENLMQLADLQAFERKVDGMSLPISFTSSLFSYVVALPVSVLPLSART